jgi:hypothetical protein
MSESKRINIGPSPAFLLFLVFLILKLTGVIGWSWWWVTCPLWGIIPIVALAFLIPCAIAFAVAGLTFLGVFIWELFKKVFRK